MTQALQGPSFVAATTSSDNFAGIRSRSRVTCCLCCPGLGLRLTAGVVDALLLWELEQQVSRLAAVAGAFKAADTASTGLLDLQQFHIFCHELNDAMPDSEVTTLFINELDRQRVGLVSFNELCRCLLSAM